MSRQPRHRSYRGPLERRLFPCSCSKVLVEAVGCQLDRCPSCGTDAVVIHARNDSDALQQRTRILERQAAV